jgi:uncharacterized protein YbjT (DUF2867 family)
MDASANGSKTVLVIGATGMLGRPVIRRAVSEGWPVRAMVRDLARARAMLPADVELVPGDLRDQASVEAAMQDVEFVHINLENAMTRSRQAWDPDADGAMVVLRVAERCGVQRLTRISALGVDEGADQWWATKAKQEVDNAFLASSVAATIFRPTWFMESFSLFARGRRLMMPGLGGAKLRWLAGDDYARQVLASFEKDSAADRVYLVQGPELLSTREAAERFAAAHPEDLRVMSLPLWPMRLAGMFSQQIAYMTKLMDMTQDVFAPIDAQAADTDLPESTMTVEDYVRYMLDTGDVPRK